MAQCTRCRGTGFRHTPRVHMNVPGLCWDCHGDGTRETQIETHRKEREAKAAQTRYNAVMERIFATAAAHGGRDSTGWPPRDRQRATAMYQEFTTVEYAAKHGLDERAAFIELCRWTQTYPVLNEAGQPRAWVRG